MTQDVTCEGKCEASDLERGIRLDVVISEKYGRPINLKRNMPSTTSDTKDHAYWEEDAPYCCLEEHMNPKDGIDGRIHLLFGENIVMVVRGN